MLFNFLKLTNLYSDSLSVKDKYFYDHFLGFRYGYKFFNKKFLLSRLKFFFLLVDSFTFTKSNIVILSSQKEHLLYLSSLLGKNKMFLNFGSLFRGLHTNFSGFESNVNKLYLAIEKFDYLSLNYRKNSFISQEVYKKEYNLILNSKFQIYFIFGDSTNFRDFKEISKKSNLLIFFGKAGLELYYDEYRLFLDSNNPGHLVYISLLLKKIIKAKTKKDSGLFFFKRFESLFFSNLIFYNFSTNLEYFLKDNYLRGKFNLKPGIGRFSAGRWLSDGCENAFFTKFNYDLFSVGSKYFFKSLNAFLLKNITVFSSSFFFYSNKFLLFKTKFLNKFLYFFRNIYLRRTMGWFFYLFKSSLNINLFIFYFRNSLNKSLKNHRGDFFYGGNSASNFFYHRSSFYCNMRGNLKYLNYFKKSFLIKDYRKFFVNVYKNLSFRSVSFVNSFFQKNYIKSIGFKIDKQLLEARFLAKNFLILPSNSGNFYSSFFIWSMLANIRLKFTLFTKNNCNFGNVKLVFRHKLFSFAGLCSEGLKFFNFYFNNLIYKGFNNPFFVKIFFCVFPFNAYQSYSYVNNIQSKFLGLYYSASILQGYEYKFSKSKLKFSQDSSKFCWSFNGYFREKPFNKNVFDLQKGSFTGLPQVFTESNVLKLTLGWEILQYESLPGFYKKQLWDYREKKKYYSLFFRRQFFKHLKFFKDDFVLSPKKIYFVKFLKDNKNYNNFFFKDLLKISFLRSLSINAYFLFNNYLFFLKTGYSLQNYVSAKITSSMLDYQKRAAKFNAFFNYFNRNFNLADSKIFVRKLYLKKCKSFLSSLFIKKTVNVIIPREQLLLFNTRVAFSLLPIKKSYLLRDLPLVMCLEWFYWYLFVQHLLRSRKLFLFQKNQDWNVFFHSFLKVVID